MEGKIPLHPPLLKGDVLLPPLKKEGWGGFDEAVSSIDNPERSRGLLLAIEVPAHSAGLPGKVDGVSKPHGLAHVKRYSRRRMESTGLCDPVKGRKAHVD
jgi:hypothetical protein